MPHAPDTIFALSSGRPPAAIAVVRMSGPRSRFGLEKMIGRLPEPRRAVLARVRDPATGEVIDDSLALWFPGPHSETGEDVAELQLHCGRARGAAAAGVPATQRAARRPGGDLAAKRDRGAGAGRGWHRLLRRGRR